MMPSLIETIADLLGVNRSDLAELNHAARNHFLSGNAGAEDIQCFVAAIHQSLLRRFPGIDQGILQEFAQDAWILFQNGTPINELQRAAHNDVLDLLRHQEVQMMHAAALGQRLPETPDTVLDISEQERQVRKERYLFDILSEWAAHCEDSRWWKSRESMERRMRRQKHQDAAKQMGISLNAQQQNAAKSQAWLRERMSQRDANKSVFRTIFHDQTQRSPLPPHAEENRQYLLQWTIKNGAICFSESLIEKLNTGEETTQDAQRAFSYHAQHCEGCSRRLSRFVLGSPRHESRCD